MGRVSSYSKEMKLKIVKRYLSGESAMALANEYRLKGKHGDDLVRKWSKQYQAIGERCFNLTKMNKTYNKTIKLSAINEYIEGKGTLESIVNKYGISDKSILRGWVIKYNSHIDIMDYDPKPEVYMAKSRKTTYEERVEIVKYCLEHEQNYKETAIKYGVNYAQVYSWVKKYKQEGEDGLLDHRGRNKLESEMTDEEKLRYQIKKLEAKTAYLEMENKALKKLEEIERRSVKGKHKK